MGNSRAKKNQLRRPHLLFVGATDGLGSEAAYSEQFQHCTISIFGRRALAIDPASKDRIKAYETDIGNAKSLSRAVTQAVKVSGAFDGCVFFQRYRGDGKEQQWDGELRVSLTGTKNVIEAITPHFNPLGGTIVVTSSVNATFITPRLGAEYHVGKAGLNQIVRYYAVKLGGQNIRVNAVSPGTFSKKRNKEFFAKNKDLTKLYRTYTPLKKVGTSQDVINVIKFLCSGEAAFITGQDIVVDGGLSLLLQDALLNEFHR